MGRPRKRKNKKEEEAEEQKPRLKGDVKRSLVAVIFFALAIISALGFFGSAGSFGDFIDKTVGIVIGWVKFIFPVFLIVAGIVLLFRKETSFYVVKLFGLGLVLLACAGLFHWFFEVEKMKGMAEIGHGGGYIGYILDYLLNKSFGSAGSLVAILAVFLLGIILAFDFSLVHVFSRMMKKKEKAEEREEEEGEDGKDEKVKEVEEGKAEEKQEEEKEKAGAENNIGHIEFVNGRDQYSDPDMPEELGTEPEFVRGHSMEQKTKERCVRPKRAHGSKWILPPEDLLEKSTGVAEGGDIEANFAIIQKTLEDFGIKVERGGVKTGPAVTQYSFRPAVGVKISKILSLQNDLALALAAHPIRIEAPIPGQSLIGIEIPNKSSQTVRLRDMLSEAKFKRRESDLSLVLGRDVSGEEILGDLARMPHLMIAGATGTGKSVCINSIITTLLYQNSPEDLKFIMVDPKRVELSLYNGIPHLLTDVVVENGKVVNALKWAVGEMERRYRALQDSGSRDIKSYQEKQKNKETILRTDPETGETMEEELKKMPYIVIVVDELADLMGSHGKEVEGAVVRLAQMARAVGIHLIVSTQRPSVEVITGIIKANITTRIAFQVATQIDSRTILDMAGAEKLLGNGDMLFLSASSPKPRRIQGVFISESEVKLVVKFIKDQAEKNKTDESEKEDEDEVEDITESRQKEILEYKAETEGNSEDDELLEAAEEEIRRSKKASASFLQRRLRVGYARAARLLDMLEEKGIVGPANGAKPREIYGLSDKEDTIYEDDVADQEKRDNWEA